MPVGCCHRCLCQLFPLDILTSSVKSFSELQTRWPVSCLEFISSVFCHKRTKHPSQLCLQLTVETLLHISLFWFSPYFKRVLRLAQNSLTGPCCLCSWYQPLNSLVLSSNILLLSNKADRPGFSKWLLCRSSSGVHESATSKVQGPSNIPVLECVSTCGSMWHVTHTLWYLLIQKYFEINQNL